MKKLTSSLLTLSLLLAALLGLNGQLTAVVQAQDEVVVLRWAVEGITDLESLDPARATNAQEFSVVGMVYGALVRLDGQLHIIPDLAESWEVSGDGLTYTFTLREDARFSDGSPVTAEDVVWSLTHALDPATGGWTGPFYLSNIVGADAVANGETNTLRGAVAVDDRTVELTIKQPSAFFLSQLTFGSAKIVSRSAAEADPGGWDQQPLASGAFMLKEWNRGESIILEANPHYWQSVGVDELEMPFIQLTEEAYQQYRAGELDIMGSQQNGVPTVHLSDVEFLPDFRRASSFSVRYVGFNHAQPPFDNLNVRRAFALATDKETLTNVVLGGSVVPTDRILPNGIPSSELPVEGLTFDPEAARAELAESGITPESLGTITLTYGLEGDNPRVAAFLQSTWREHLGVDVELEALDLPDFSTRLNDTFQDPSTGLQMYYSIWGADYPDPQNFLSQQLRTGVGNNNGHYSNPEFDALVDEADIIVDDEERRYQLYNNAEQIAVSEVGWLPLFNPELNVLIKPYVDGMFFTGQGIMIPDYSGITGLPR